MTDFAPNLDDLRFQKDLVDEARRRIIQYCPEWTDYNLSDPGITLIELFAYMTEMQVYRLNRVPERNYLKFLEMMGFQPRPASSARAELTFYLSAPLPLSPEDDLIVTVPKGLEVTSRPNEEETPVTFTLDDRLVLESPKMTQVRKQTDIVKNYLQRMGIEPFYAFDQFRPKVGDTFYIGFDVAHDIRGYILRLTFECEQTQAVGIRRDDPPWVWECSTGEGRWQKLVPSTRTGEKDTTGGLNNENGSIVFYLPLSANPDQVHGKNAFWLRCRIEQRSPEQGMYSESPKVTRIEAHTLGGTTWATHATIEQGESLGHSSGEPGQVFHLKHAPVLAFQDGETIEVEERDGSELFYRAWSRVDDFSKSDRYDRHFTLDESTGEIRFGPGVRQPDGSICQYGRVPEAGRKVQLTQYRYGGGIAGNVPAGKIQVMRSAVPYIDKVTNFKRADGGRDQESLDEVKMRAKREMRAQQRAVTSEDYEDLCRAACRTVARAKCNGASGASKELSPGVIEMLVVPAVHESLRTGDLSKLALEQPLIKEIRAHLDKYRLLTTILRIREPGYLGIKVKAEIVAVETSQPAVVRSNVLERIKEYLSPLSIGSEEEKIEVFGSKWEGWPFGRGLFVSELFSLIQKVPGVRHVLDVKVSYKEIDPRELTPLAELEGEADFNENLTALTQRMLPVPNDTLLCSLNHEIEVVDL